MKYFTKAWCFGELDDREIDLVANNYKLYINSIFNKIPFVLKLLANELNLHDGIIKNVTFHQKNRNLTLNGIFGDLQSGYFSLEIKYMNTSNLDVKSLLTFFQDEKIIILSDEIELHSEKIFSHRIITSSKKELEIIFSDLALRIRNTKARSYKIQNCTIRTV